MTASFAWICAVVAAVATLGAAYFFDRSAEESIERARHEAEIKTAELEHATEQLREKNKNLDVEQERLKAQNLQLSIELERARTAHFELEGKLASRTLTDVQKRSIVEALRQRGQTRIVVTRLGDKEAADYASQLISTFQAGGAEVLINYVGVMSPPIYGLRVAPGNGVDQIVAALKAADIRFELGGNAGEFAVLFVGLKPPSL